MYLHQAWIKHWRRKSFLDRSRVDTVTLVVFVGTERKPNGSPCVKVRIGTSFVQRQSEAWPAHRQSHSWCTVTARWGWVWSADDKPIGEHLNAVIRKYVRGIRFRGKLIKKYLFDSGAFYFDIYDIFLNIIFNTKNSCEIEKFLYNIWFIVFCI